MITENKVLTVITIGLGAFLIPFSITSLNVALPTISRDLSMNTISMSLTLISFLLAASIFLLPFGNIGDNHSRKTVFISGIGIFIFASFMSAVSQTATILIIARALCGIGSAMILSNGMPVLIESFPANERGKILGVYSAFIYVGLALGSIIGGFLTQLLSWRWIFFIILPIGLSILILSFKLPQQSKRLKHSKFDIIGFILYAMSLFLIIYGFAAIDKSKNIIYIVIGFLLLLVFIAKQLRSKSPLIDVRIFLTNKTFAMSSLSVLTLYISTFSFPFILSLYLQLIRGFDVQTTGLILIIQPVFMSIVAPISGKLSDRIQPRIVASSGIIFIIIGFLLLAYLQYWPFIIPIIALSLMGIGFGLFSSPNANAVMSCVDKSIYGVASAALGTMRTIGQTMSMALVALIFSANIRYSNAKVSMHDIKIIFFVSIIIAFISLIFSLLRGKIHRNTFVDSNKTSAQILS